MSFREMISLLMEGTPTPARRARRRGKVSEALMDAGLPGSWFTKRRTLARARDYRNAFYALSRADRRRAAQVYGMAG